ncbi:MAG: hypothetical protein JKY81_00175, partial [Colwellia sp.]|nr:hypothetical protein [Colwellia sp.]
MSDINSELLRSAARELCSYIDDANGILERGISCTDETPPDYHDHQTCCELDKAADYMDTLVAQVAELRGRLNDCVNDYIKHDKGDLTPSVFHRSAMALEEV